MKCREAGNCKGGKTSGNWEGGERQAGSGVLSREEGTGIKKHQWELKLGAVRV